MKNKTYLAFGLTLVGIGIGAFAVDNLVVFNPGSPIKSAEVNQNFTILRNATVALETFKDAIISNGCKPGEALASVAADGKVSCIAVGGSGGTSYSAGAGLALNGNQFSVADAGVTASKISPDGGSNGQVLKLVGGAVTWATDATSSGGGGGLSSVNVIAPLSGDGTSGSPIGITNNALGLSKLDIAGSPASGRFLGYNGSKLEWQTATSGISSVQTDDTLKGNGTSGNKLGINLPLVLTGNHALPILSVSNTGGGLTFVARSNLNTAVIGQSGDDAGVEGSSQKSVGVYGTSSSSTTNVSGVLGENTSSSGQVVGVLGRATASPIGVGVWAESSSGNALWAVNNGSNATFGVRQQGSGDLIAAFGTNAISARFRVTNDGTVISKGVTLTSDRNVKANFKAIDSQAVLDKVARLPMSRWNYKDDAANVQHIGPMAQDFHAAFGLNGGDDKHISAIDAQGVALAAIQGLNQKLEQEAAQRKALEGQNADLKNQLLRLEARLSALEVR